MDANAGSFVAVRRLSGSDRAAAFHHSSGGRHGVDGVDREGAFLRLRAQRRDSDARLSFDLTPTQEALQALWCASFPGTELRGLISDQWKEMGWQGKDPSTDFRYGLFWSVSIFS
ncbi:hypothetical protein PR202_gb09226 [Eleusine coracana subsp. coracana]|uniref:ELMO domain-containing protein n=1 Tax=Eleusine coracana subsp. coracana TaxID=191504 RepID=A0AAV5EE92_ELECO|nr:hypothetical protein PR202_gb09226 [Eleusine coracana subsp. coracana]